MTDWAKRYESMAESANTLQAQLNSRTEQVLVLQDQLRNCQQALDIQKQVVRDSISQDNEIKQANAEEIRRLRAMLQEAGINPN